AFEDMEALGEFSLVGDVLGKGLDQHPGFEALPIGQAERRALIIVEYRHLHHRPFSSRITPLAFRRLTGNRYGGQSYDESGENHGQRDAQGTVQGSPGRVAGGDAGTGGGGAVV